VVAAVPTVAILAAMAAAVEAAVAVGGGLMLLAYRSPERRARQEHRATSSPRRAADNRRRTRPTVSAARGRPEPRDRRGGPRATNRERLPNSLLLPTATRSPPDSRDAPLHPPPRTSPGRVAAASLPPLQRAPAPRSGPHTARRKRSRIGP